MSDRVPIREWLMSMPLPRGFPREMRYARGCTCSLCSVARASAAVFQTDEPELQVRMDEAYEAINTIDRIGSSGDRVLAYFVIELADSRASEYRRARHMLLLSGETIASPLSCASRVSIARAITPRDYRA